MSSLIPQLIEEAVADELESVAEELKEARSLEVTYADRLEQFKESYDVKARELIDIIVAESVAEEFDELKEDIELAKKHQFAISLTESFGDVFKQMFGESDFESAVDVSELQAQLESYKRREKVAELTEGLQGRALRIAETVLADVPVEKMETKMESVRGFITEAVSDKNSDENLNESDKQDDDKEQIDEGSTIVLENEENDKKPSQKEPTDRGQRMVARSLKRV